MKKISLALLVASSTFLLAGGDVSPVSEVSPVIEPKQVPYNPNPDLTHIDFPAGLIWMDQLYTETERITYHDGNSQWNILDKAEGKVGPYDYAVKYCSTLNYAGQNDWRLPTRKELEIMYHADASVQIFNYEQTGYFWTNTATSSGHIAVYTREGYGYHAHDGRTQYIRCVRDSKEDLFL